MSRAPTLGASLLVLVVLCAACKKTAELAPTDPGSPAADDAGSAAAAPSPDDAGATSGKGRPRNLNIEHGTAALRPRLDACYVAALAAHPEEKGGTELSLSIAADGHVKEAKVSGSSLSNDTLDCVRRTAEAFAFGALDRDTVIMVPLSFASRTDAGAGDRPERLDGGAWRSGRARDGGAR